MLLNIQYLILNIVKLQSQVQTSVLGLGVNFVLILSQQEQHKEEEPCTKIYQKGEFDTKDQVLYLAVAVDIIQTPPHLKYSTFYHMLQGKMEKMIQECTETVTIQNTLRKRTGRDEIMQLPGARSHHLIPRKNGNATRANTFLIQR